MIKVKDLTFSYNRQRSARFANYSHAKEKQILHGLNFTVEDGEIFGFLGPNGSGKSTTQKILTGILTGFGGSVSLFGQDISKIHGPDFFRNIGVLFEFPYLYANLSAIDNLNYFSSFYPKERRRDPQELLNMLEFKTDFLKKPVSSYSKGMRQRVSMARALIGNPRLLFLDEPTSGLDPLMQKEFFDILREQNKKGTTVFLSSHILSEIQHNCARAAIIREGRIIACDSVEALSRTNARRVTVHGSVDLDKLEGIRDRRDEPGVVSFLYYGNMDSLLQVLAAGRISDLSVSEPDLEEIFMYYYEKKDGDRI